MDRVENRVSKRGHRRANLLEVQDFETPKQFRQSRREADEVVLRMSQSQRRSQSGRTPASGAVVAIESGTAAASDSGSNRGLQRDAHAEEVDDVPGRISECRDRHPGQRRGGDSTRPILSCSLRQRFVRVGAGSRGQTAMPLEAFFAGSHLNHRVLTNYNVNPDTLEHTPPKGVEDSS